MYRSFHLNDRDYKTPSEFYLSNNSNKLRGKCCFVQSFWCLTLRKGLVFNILFLEQKNNILDPDLYNI